MGVSLGVGRINFTCCLSIFPLKDPTKGMRALDPSSVTIVVAGAEAVIDDMIARNTDWDKTKWQSKGKTHRFIKRRAALYQSHE